MKTLILITLIISLCMATSPISLKSPNKSLLIALTDTILEAPWNNMLPFFINLPWNSYENGFFIGPDKIIFYSSLSSEEQYKDFLLLILKIRYILNQ